jgi:hypothetical protein
MSSAIPSTNDESGTVPASAATETLKDAKPTAKTKIALPMYLRKEKATTTKVKGDPLQLMIALQTFEGFWEWTQGLFEIVGVNEGDVATKMDKSLDKKVVATALAVRFLEIKLAGEKESWELIVDKAMGWLEEKLGSEEKVKEVLTMVNGLL